MIVEENAVHTGCRLLKVIGGCKALTWLWSSHLISIGMGVSTEIAQRP